MSSFLEIIARNQTRAARRDFLWHDYDPLTGRIVPLGRLPEDWDPSAPGARDGEWHMVVTLPHEVVEHDGYGVPAFEGDVERKAWEDRRRSRR